MAHRLLSRKACVSFYGLHSATPRNVKSGRLVSYVHIECERKSVVAYFLLTSFCSVRFE